MGDKDIYDIDGFTPDEVREYFAYLDGLRESGITNMYGAGKFLERDYELDPRGAGRVLARWMLTFRVRHRKPPH